VDAAERLAPTAFCAELPELWTECARQPVDRQWLLARIEGEATHRHNQAGISIFQLCALLLRKQRPVH
jgi:hypothetical protein